MQLFYIKKSLEAFLFLYFFNLLRSNTKKSKNLYNVVYFSIINNKFYLFKIRFK
ncbi:hypothetical protein CV643_05570 [Borreliella burgdorferi]|nr:hypothetical protein BBUWI9123_J0023 [Borreliella burgdorferi WI91-23]PRQ92053.1 hypothetical protein CV690_05575 [Borreliella burgdorferi]PRQ94767.1 hypothetical protein CV684_05405 [Borreliella burgdorferi]PRQ97453.1 hypothetical protein CV674_05145 [Borreliella burgdorferi]PRR21072.1 hypothetical protein CV643_05570 [Borreliella burgdorferi]